MNKTVEDLVEKVREYAEEDPAAGHEAPTTSYGLLRRPVEHRSELSGATAAQDSERP